MKELIEVLFDNGGVVDAWIEVDEERSDGRIALRGWGLVLAADDEELKLIAEQTKVKLETLRERRKYQRGNLAILGEDELNSIALRIITPEYERIREQLIFLQIEASARESPPEETESTTPEPAHPG